MRYFIRSADGTWDLGSVEAADKDEAQRLLVPIFGRISKGRLKKTRVVR
jgi:hypothetical protein